MSTLRFADDRNGWAGVGDLWSTHDGGATWHRQTAFPAFSGRVAGIGTGGGYVYAYIFNCPSQGGNSCSQTSQVFASPVGRDAWTAVTPTVNGSSYLTGLTVQGSTWFLPVKDGIWQGSGTGAGVRRPTPCANPGFTAADSTHLDAMCAGDGAAGSASYQLYGSTDGGRTCGDRAVPPRTQRSERAGRQRPRGVAARGGEWDQRHPADHQ